MIQSLLLDYAKINDDEMAEMMLAHFCKGVRNVIYGCPEDIGSPVPEPVKSDIEGSLRKIRRIRLTIHNDASKGLRDFAEAEARCLKRMATANKDKKQ